MRVVEREPRELIFNCETPPHSHIFKKTLIKEPRRPPNYSDFTACTLLLRNVRGIRHKAKCSRHNCTPLEIWLCLDCHQVSSQGEHKGINWYLQHEPRHRAAIIKADLNKQPNRTEKKTRILETVIWWWSESDINIQHINGTNIRNETRARSGILSRKRPRKFYGSKSC